MENILEIWENYEGELVDMDIITEEQAKDLEWKVVAKYAEKEKIREERLEKTEIAEYERLKKKYAK